MEIKMKEKVPETEIDTCRVKCRNCGSVFNSTLTFEGFNCPNCQQSIIPSKDVVVESETEIH